MYDQESYFFDLSVDQQTTIFSSDNQRRAALQLSLPSTVHFSYYIDIACKDTDDCARELAINLAIDISQRHYSFPQIMNELEPLILGPPLSWTNPELNCYNAKEKPQQCATVSSPGSCSIVNRILSNKISSSCIIDQFYREISIRIYQDKGDPTFDIRCNRNLCNGRSTLQTVKAILFQHNITQTADGRLNGSRFHISMSLMIITTLIVLSNRFF